MDIFLGSSLLTFNKYLPTAEAYLETCETSVTELFPNTVYG